MKIDTSELDKLGADLATKQLSAVVRPAVLAGAKRTKDQLTSEMASSPSFRGVAGSISYEMKLTPDGPGAEIGPDKSRRGGALANIAYFGGAHGGGGTVPDPMRALESAAAETASAMTKAVVEAFQ